MSHKYKKYLVYLLLIILPFFSLLIPKHLTGVKLKIMESASLPLRIILFPFKELKKIVFYHRTHNQYQKLKGEVDILKNRFIGVDEVLRENNRFRELLKFKRSLIFSSVAANVVGRDPSNWNASIIIDRGKEDGLKPGMPVVNAAGVIGKVSETYTTTSKVILLIDPNFSVAALVQRTRDGGLISGTLQGICRLHYLSDESDVRVGDKVITSKLSSSFPDGLYIGEVIRVRTPDGSPAIECLVRPAVLFSELEEVIVIQN